jgi:antitoxin (DNA-binding transcriptional repressor) of toxin-antitoxin stability system
VKKVGIREVKNRLGKYGALAHAGETITVCKNGKPWFELKPYKPARPRTTKTMSKAEPVNTESAVLAPVDAKDLEGWF